MRMLLHGSAYADAYRRRDCRLACQDLAHGERRKVSDELAISGRVLLPMTVVFPHPFFLAAAAGHGEQGSTIFFAQVLLLIAIGRLLGEWMQRIGQPAVIGQLLAGIILGPSVFGAIWPAGQQAIFPPNSSDRQMINAVSDIGVLLLLLLTT
jgi:Sodium/hydrogen exchanger family